MKKRDYIIFAVLLGLAIAYPWINPPRYLLASVLLMFCYATVVSQWNLVFGLAGIFSLGQVAIFASGSYITAILGRYLEWSLWYTFPVAGVGGVFFSLLMGIALIQIEKDKRKPVFDVISGLQEVVIKIVFIIMMIAPVGVFALIANTITTLAKDDPHQIVSLLGSLGTDTCFKSR